LVPKPAALLVNSKSGIEKKNGASAEIYRPEDAERGVVERNLQHGKAPE
jgi:hypothetical protein